MKFLLDANVRQSVGKFLQAAGHDVRYLSNTDDRGLPDNDVLTLAVREQRILLTNDRDFGTLVYQQKRPHKGVLFFRLQTETADAYTTRLAEILKTHHNAITHHFVVITNEHVRIR